MTVPDVPDWAGNTAFIDSGRALDSQVNANVGSGYTSPVLDVSRFQSLALTAEWSGAAGAAAGTIDVSWVEGGQTAWIDAFSVWNDAALTSVTESVTFVIPCVAATCQVALTQPAAGDLLTYSLAGSARPVPNLRGRAYGARSYGGQTFQTNPGLAAGVTETFYAGPTPGPASLLLASGGQPQFVSVFAELPTSSGVSEQRIVTTTTSSQTFLAPLILPPAALKIQVKNTGTATSSYFFCLTTDGR